MEKGLTPSQLLAAKLGQTGRNWEITRSYKGVMGEQIGLCWEIWAEAEDMAGI